MDCSQKEKQRQAARSSNVVIVVASHYQSLQIIVFLSQAGLLEIYLFCKISLLRSRSDRSHVTLPVPTRLLQNRHTFLSRCFALLFARTKEALD